ncbi:dihydropteroate synthase [bacterium]|nr:dihydropteroate synthase [bacterium]
MSGYWQLGAKLIDLSTPRIMAIVNATPDSFYAASRLGSHRKDALYALIKAGADMLDVGGQSTRPGSARVGPEQEAERVVPVVEELRQLSEDIPVTVDTYHSSVARAALDAGADGINDISGGRFDAGLLPLIAERRCGYVLMHMLGTPETMQADPHYTDCVAEVAEFFRERLAALKELGIDLRRVVLDPGIGFGKRLEDNLALMTHAAELGRLRQPLLLGVSRKSFIASISGEQDAGNRLAGTLGATWGLLDQGVMLHRVHDPRAIRQLMDVWLAWRAARES